MLKFSLLLVCLVFMFRPSWSQNPIAPSIPDELAAAKFAKIGGYVGSRFDASYQNRILVQDVDRLIEPFRNRTETSCWQSEFWGKWFTSAVLAYRYKPEPRLKTILDNAVEGLISTQSADGYIGNYADDKHLEAWDIWGRKYCMLGLLAYFDLTGEKKSLDAAAKVAVHLMNELKDRNALIVRQGNHRGMAASSVLEPICLLYSRTGEKKYLDFAEEIVRQWETADGPQLLSKSEVPVAERFPKPQSNWYGWEQGQKAYEMMSCYEGLLELYRLTGKEIYKTSVEKTWKNIQDTEINVAGSGSAMECWFHGKEHETHPNLHYQETCVTATWIKLSQQLLRLTGEVKYADAIEQAFYNALLGSMNIDGSDWAKYTPLSGQRLKGNEQCNMGLNCCVASGPRGLFTFPLTAVMSATNGVQINFFADGSYELQTPKKQKIVIVQKTNYPESGKVILMVQMVKPEKFSISVRIPEWSANSSLEVNSEKFDLGDKQLATMQRVWKSGDSIEINLDMRGRIVQMGYPSESIAIFRGPVLLSRDSRLGEPDMDAIISPLADKMDYFELEQKATKKDAEIWMEFSGVFLPESYQEGGSKPIRVDFCDYASAGNSKESHPFFNVWLPQLFDPRK